MPADEWKMPLLAKVYEAFSAAADGRVVLHGNYAKVSSSDYKKEYTIAWEGDVYSSNDNASYWQGSLGYPVIAVLMAQGKLTYDKSIAALFSGIEWKTIIRKLRNDYTAASEAVLERLKEKGTDIEPVRQEANNVYEQIGNLKIGRKRGSARPPA